MANEHDLFQSGNDLHEAFVAYVRDMLAAGAPIDAVGMQGHFFAESSTEMTNGSSASATSGASCGLAKAGPARSCSPPR